jgi:glycosyltransferase involved in cell wall biosynthesis
MPIRVLYSFPHKLGAGRICYTAWQQVTGLAAAGVEVLTCPGAVSKSVYAENVRMRPTLARGRLRLPYRVLGTMRACALHDWIVARRLQKLAASIDIVHTWPLGALETLKTAARLGIPSVLERPNAHTRFAYEVVQKECDRLGVHLPPDHEHAFNLEVLAREEAEYSLATRLLCPSDFTARTFVEQGYSPRQLARHQYGYDPEVYFADAKKIDRQRSFTMLFVGVCAVRKGLHFALDAWLKSPAHRDGTFLIAGEFLPAYAKKLSGMLEHPSVHVLGHRTDIPQLMRRSDVLVLPSIEEGYGLVCADALGSGCVPLVSNACTESCRHMENALVHDIGDVDTLRQHITMLYTDRALLNRLRQGALESAPAATWTAAGVKLRDVYRDVIASYGSHSAMENGTPEGIPRQTAVSRI